MTLIHREEALAGQPFVMITATPGHHPYGPTIPWFGRSWPSTADTISVGAREPLLAWARQRCTPEQIAAVAEEETLYLIPSYDKDEEAMELLKEGYAGIFEAELEFWCNDEATWPQERTLEQFLEWFEIRFFPLIVDLCSDDLESGQVDEEFVEEMRVVCLQQGEDLSPN